MLSAAQPFALNTSMPAERSRQDFSMVSLELKILCSRRLDKHRDLPGSLRRTRAGSVTIVFSSGGSPARIADENVIVVRLRHFAAVQSPAAWVWGCQQRLLGSEARSLLREPL